jgi:hypothetical protein
MTSAVQPARNVGGPSSTGLEDVVESVSDKGMVLDAYARIAVVSIDVVTVDARMAMASDDAYLEFADAVDQLDLSDREGLPICSTM